MNKKEGRRDRLLDGIREAQAHTEEDGHQIRHLRRTQDDDVWGYPQKVPVRRRIRRASPDAIAVFREWAGHIIPKRISEGRVAAIQDGVMVTDDARPGRRILPRTCSLRHMGARTSCS